MPGCSRRISASRSLRSSVGGARAARAAPGSREPSRAASRPAASIPRARALVLLAGGTRKRGSPAAIVITAPFPGAAIEPVSSLHSVPRAAFGVAMLTLLRVPFCVWAMRYWRTPDWACGPRCPELDAEGAAAAFDFVPISEGKRLARLLPPASASDFRPRACPARSILAHSSVRCMGDPLESRPHYSDLGQLRQPRGKAVSYSSIASMRRGRLL